MLYHALLNDIEETLVLWRSPHSRCIPLDFCNAVSAAILVQGILADSAARSLSRDMPAPPEPLAAAAEVAQEAHAEEAEATGGQDDVVGGHPNPPYDASSRIEDGVMCYYPGCNHTSKQWGRLLKHLKNVHKTKLSRLVGTYLYTVGMPDIISQQVEFRKKQKETGACEKKKNARPKEAERDRGNAEGSSGKKRRPAGEERGAGQSLERKAKVA